HGFGFGHPAHLGAHLGLERLDSSDKLLETLGWYVDKMLPLEMTRVCPHSPEPEGTCHILVLLVGYSLEPLLQTICFYQPKRIVLVLSKNYGSTVGDVMGGYIERLVGRLVERRLLEHETTIGPKDDQGYFREVKSNPAHVFRLLLDELKSEPPEQVVVDITGARKSMVAGAFFYAAFAGVAISYVEFDDTNYNLVLGRPEGYRSVIRRLPNPYTTFALREWGRVRHLYTHYNFRSAQEVLNQDILPVVKQLAPDSDRSFFEPEQIQAVEELIKILEFYELWDKGDFQGAASKSVLLPDASQPLAVQKLIPLWPPRLESEDGESAARQLVNNLDEQMCLDHENRSFLLRPLFLGVYVADEISRIERLMNLHQDYRSALMRATGLYEMLLHARILTLWYIGAMEYRPSKSSSWQLLEKGSDNWCEQYGPIEKMRGLTQYEKFVFEHEPYERKRTSTHVRWPDNSTYELPSTVQLPDAINELRHKTTHRAIPVPKSTAHLAWQKLRVSFDDYCTKWAPHLETDFNLPEPGAIAYQAQPWSAICELCGLSKVLPPTLLSNERSGT
ncbi:MAG TPA: hypothetical protein EYP49_20285, partial [Anaerolineae bacterium]|nr:hypothetical protein [Anaerolineae bacterium]